MRMREREKKLMCRYIKIIDGNPWKKVRNLPNAVLMIVAATGTRTFALMNMMI